MDVVLVGLPGSGKSVVGRRLAARHDAQFIDLDSDIERAAGMTVAAIFSAEGEAGFRARERVAIERLGAADTDAGVRRVISAGGGALVDPRSRWSLLRGRRSVWLDVRPEVAAQRLRRSRHVRPLVASSPDPIAAIRRLATDRERFYAAAEIRIRSVADPVDVATAVETELGKGSAGSGTALLRADTRIGRFVLGDGIAGDALGSVLDDLAARRVVVVTEPVARQHLGDRLVDALREAGRSVDVVVLPRGEDAKRLGVIEQAAGELASLRADRSDPIVAVGGGALGDAAGFLAATWLRGVPLIHVPTTLVAQIDSAIGGKTAVDIAAGKNLVGAFHQPEAVVVDVAALRTLGDRDRRGALGEAVKMAALGDDRLFALLEAEGTEVASGSEAAWASGAVAELVERCLWAKVETVLGDERETADASDAAPGRIALNLGHTVGHALEAVTGFGPLLHGEAVAYGLRAAARIGVAADVTPPERAARIEALLDRLGLGVEPLDRAPFSVTADAVLDALATDKKHRAGTLRWVLVSADGAVTRTGVAPDVVRYAIVGVLAGRGRDVAASAGGERTTAGDTASATVVATR